MESSRYGYEALSDLMEAGSAMSVLAKDEKAFRQAYEAFRSGDGKSFQDVLRRHNLLSRCSLVCHWIRSKECVFYCLRFCGLPKAATAAPNPRQLAEAIVRITSNPKAVEHLVQVLEKRDQAGFEKIIIENKLESLCHFFCHWLCFIRFRLVCRVVCNFPHIEKPNLVQELQAAGHALGELLKKKESFDQAVAASNAGDSDKLRAAIDTVGLVPFCHFICEWFCSWRCTLVCLNLCREFPPITIQDEIGEAFAFAKVTQDLVQRPAEVEKLMAALGAGDTRAWGVTIRELKLERYCIQLCHWVCGLRCRRFCILVCPPQPTIPLFTHVGQYKITTDFTGDGTTTSGNLAFTTTIPLIGIMPDGTAPDPLEYRFTREVYPLGPAPVAVDSTMIPPSRIGELEFYRWDTLLLAWVLDTADYWVNNPGAMATIPQQIGPPLSVPVNKDVKPGGWVEVPTENSLFIGGVGRFIPNTGVLVELDTTKLTNETFDLSVVAPPLPLAAGDSVPVANRAHKPLYRINFETRKVGTVALLNANSLQKIALSNTHYTYIRHMDWAGYKVTPPSGDSIFVLSLDVQELIAGGCSPLGKDVHARFTAYHPYLGSCSVYLEGPGIPPPAAVSPAISADGEAVSAGLDFDISGLGPCAYIVWLTATLRLTAGYGAAYGTFSDHIAFCKK